jgi:hypothetical protein
MLNKTLLLLAALILPVFAAAPEPRFQVKVNGEALRLHDFHGGAIGQFDLVKASEIEIRAAFDIRWVDVRPRSAGAAPIISPGHGSVRLRVNRPVPLTVEFNGDWKRNSTYSLTRRRKTRPSQACPGSGTLARGSTSPDSLS